MSKKTNKAENILIEGFSCSQAVLSVFSDQFGLEGKKALQISQPFGGGMAQMGLTCGAVTGAFMAIGLAHGRTEASDTQAKDKTYALMKEFLRRFEKRHSSITCRELIGIDLSSEEEHERAKNEGIFDKICNELVKSAVEITEDLLQ